MWAYFMHCGEYERILCTVVNMSVFCALWWIWAYFMHCGEYERILSSMVNMSVFCALWWTWAYFMHCGEYERILCTVMCMSVFCALWLLRGSSCPTVSINVFRALWWICLWVWLFHALQWTSSYFMRFGEYGRIWPSPSSPKEVVSGLILTCRCVFFSKQQTCHVFPLHAVIFLGLKSQFVICLTWL